MDVITVYPMGGSTYIVRRGCGYYIEVKGETHPINQETAHRAILGNIPRSEHRKGSSASGEIEVK